MRNATAASGLWRACTAAIGCATSHKEGARATGRSGFRGNPKRSAPHLPGWARPAIPDLPRRFQSGETTPSWETYRVWARARGAPNIDFRPADGDPNSVYGVTDTGRIYLIGLDPARPSSQLISSVTPRFAGGFQSLMDFNPAVNALRLVGSNDQNFAVANANGGSLNQTTVQTPLAFAPGDPNAGRDANITAGAYSNNQPNVPQTIFFMLDYDLDSLLTIAPPLGPRGSNTGGGQLRTIGPLTDAEGRPINIAPTAGLDIYTSNGANVGVAVSGQRLYCIGLDAIDPAQPVGTPLQKVFAEQVPTQTLVSGSPPPTGGFIDVAVAPPAPPAAAAADVAVTAVGPSSPFEETGLTLTVSNLGPGPAKSVTLKGSSLSRLANLRLGASSNEGTCRSGTDGPATFSCQFEVLPSQGSARVLVFANFQSTQSNPVLVDVTATATSPVSDPVPGNNSVRANVIANPIGAITNSEPQR